MSCGDPKRHYVDDTRLGRELAEFEATDPKVAEAAAGLDRLRDRARLNRVAHFDGTHEFRPDCPRCDSGLPNVCICIVTCAHTDCSGYVEPLGGAS